MIILDTTILVYAKGGQHPLRGPCRKLLMAVEARQVSATTTVEVIQEFAHVWARRRSRSEAVDLARSYVDLLAPLLPVGERDLQTGLRLFERFPSLGAFDAVIAAASIGTRAEAFVSADRSFREVQGLRYVAPGSAEFDRLMP
jgi:uncharacterized protein